jgi:Protein of unknown function (DUF3455)
MTHQFHRVLAASMVVFAFQSYIAMGQSPADAIKVPQVPSEIQVPPGNAAFLRGQAIGTQNYICLPADAGFTWKFVGPQATLFVGIQYMNRSIFQQVATHYLSPNALENGTARPTWQNSLDSSAAWGKAIASSTDSQFVAPGAVPWLLLQVVGTRLGPTGGTSIAETTFIQRLSTSGGTTPSTGCAQSADVGATAFVPYTADYYFYRASH